MSTTIHQDDSGLDFSIDYDAGKDTIYVTDDSLVFNGTTTISTGTISPGTGLSGSLNGNSWVTSVANGGFPSFSAQSLQPSQLPPSKSIVGGDPGDIATDVEFLIVTRTGDLLMLNEKNPITPREMIGICKFIMLAQSCDNITVDWSEIIHVLGIERHFDDVGSLDMMLYDHSVVYIHLYDPA